MRTKALFLFCVLFALGVAHAKSARNLRISGQVAPRLDRVLRLEKTGLLVQPREEPSLKISVLPLSDRGPASLIEKRITETERIQGPARILVEAP